MIRKCFISDADGFVWVFGEVKGIKESKGYSSLIISDGTGEIEIRFFKEEKEKVFEFSEGDIVSVVGKVKEWQGVKYIAPKYITKAKKEAYEFFKKYLEILNKRFKKEEIKKIEEKPKEEKIELEEEVAEETKDVKRTKDKKEIKKKVKEKEKIEETVEEKRTASLRKEIIRLLEKLDTGEGVDVEELIELLGISKEEFEKIVNELISAGEVYEPRPGKLKLLK